MSAVAATVAVAGLVSTGCAAGQVAQTADQKSAIDGINATVRTMDLRLVALQSPPDLRTNYPKGSTAAFTLVFVNNARTADRLVGVQTSAAGGWTAYATQADTFRAIQGSLTTPSASAPESGSASATESASSSTSQSAPASSPTSESASSSSESGSATKSGSATPSGSAGASSSARAAAPRGVQSVTIPAGGRVGFGTPEATGGLVLQKLTRTLHPADTIKVTFTFANAGSVTVPVTVQVQPLGRTAVVGTPEGGEAGEG